MDSPDPRTSIFQEIRAIWPLKAPCPRVQARTETGRAASGEKARALGRGFEEHAASCDVTCMCMHMHMCMHMYDMYVHVHVACMWHVLMCNGVPAAAGCRWCVRRRAPQVPGRGGGATPADPQPAKRKYPTTFARSC